MTPVYREVHLNGRTFRVLPEANNRRVIGFLLKIDFDSDSKTGCWRWMGADDGQVGYGRFFDGNRMVPAHRFAWTIFKGPLFDFLHLHHQVESPVHCIGPACVNADHCLPLTPAEHNLIYTPANITAINSAKTECAKGHSLLDENCYLSPGGHRRCRICHNEWQNQRNRARAARRAPKPAITHCPKGHPYDAENAYEYLGRKQCRACHAELTARQYHERKAAKGIESHKRVFFSDQKACKRGHDLKLSDAIYRFTLHGQPKACCRLCKEEAGRATYEKWKLAHANDPKPPRRKSGPKPRYNDRIVSESDLGPFATGGPVFRNL